jgi:predicted MFS family arabinose efflux permease
MLTPYIVGAAARDAKLALQPNQLGLLAASLVCGAITVMVTSVFWVRRCNWRVVTICGAAIAVTANLIASSAHTFGSLLTIMLVASCGTGVVYAPATCALSDTRDPDRSFALSFFLQIVVSGAAGFAISELGQQWGLGGVLRLIAGFFAAAFLLAALLPARGVKDGTSPDTGQSAAGLHIWVGLAGMLLLNAGSMAVWAFYERIGAAAGFSEQTVGNVIALALLMGAPGALFSSMAAKRFGRSRPLVISTLAMIVTFVTAVDTHNPNVYLVSALLFQFLSNFGLAFQYGAMSVADVSGRLIVLGPTFQGVGGMLGPTVAGMLAKEDDYTPVAATGALLTAAGLVLILWLCRAASPTRTLVREIPPNR